ncbi:MAG: DUF2703 domain-containing protein [Bacteroidota bacterium]
MNVRLFYFEGCPNVEATFDLLRECLADEKVTGPIVRTRILDEAQAAEHGFLGSPSIQINGEDIESARRDDKPFFGCRIYDSASTTPGVPSRQTIIDAIRRARGRA